MPDVVLAEKPVLCNTGHHGVQPSRSRFSRFKSATVTAVILGLGLMNILTLVDDGVHAALYRVVQKLVENPVGDAFGKLIFSQPVLSNSTTNRRVADVRGATTKLMAEKAALVVENSALHIRNTNLMKQQVVLEERHKASMGAVRRVSLKVAARTVKNAARNFSSMVLEAVPTIGTGVMVAVTAADLNDACETIKDLNEMNSVTGLAVEDSKKVCGFTIPTAKEVLASAKQQGKSVYAAAADAIANLKKLVNSRE